ncbi:MAG: alanine racemase [Candidatus Dormibacteria bacterium]
MPGPPPVGPATHPSLTPVKWAEVDVAALRDNVAALCRHVAPAVRVMAMIKANGYGHGALLAARAALEGGAAWLGVSSAEEALQIRAGGIDAPLLVVGWTHPGSHQALIAAGVDLTVFDGDSIARLSRAARQGGRTARAHVKIDTGMGRLGARPEQMAGLAAALAEARGVEVAGVFTHFADADGSDPCFTEEQFHTFERLADPLRQLAPEALLHCANSAAMLRFPQMHADLVRPGIALYGYPPALTGTVAPLRPAMTMVALITQVKTIRRGDSVGYGRTWRAIRDTRVATVAAGYADGVQRAQSNRGRLVVRGHGCPIVGRVSMDQLVIDVSDLDTVAAGDEAVLFGRRGGVTLGADEVAAAGGTICYEVLCAVSARVARIAVNA